MLKRARPERPTRRGFALAGAAVCALLVSGCAGPILTRTSVAHGTNAPTSGSYEINQGHLPEAAAASSVYGLALEAARARLAQSGWQEAGSAASHLLSLSLSSRRADFEIAADQDVRGPAKQRRLLQSCPDQEHRLVLALVDQATGSVDHRITVSETHCHATMDEVAESLAKRAAEGLALAAGNHKSHRQGKD